MAVEEQAGILRVRHRGRPLNDAGRDPARGRTLGYGRDLFNMLVAGASEKHDGDAVTGKFGLGFKSVHLVADAVRIASGFLRVRIIGTLLVDDAPAPGQGETLIELVVGDDHAAAGEAVAAFAGALPWLALTARSARIELRRGADVRVVNARRRPFADAVELAEADGRRALVVDLGDGFTMLLALDAGGLRAVADGQRGPWCLAPLQEGFGGGWIIDGPWPIDPGRSRVGGTVAERQARMQRLGDRLEALHAHLSRDWPAAATALGLDATEGLARLLAPAARDVRRRRLRRWRGCRAACGRARLGPPREFITAGYAYAKRPRHP